MRQFYLIISLANATLAFFLFDSAYAQFGSFNYGSSFATPLYIAISSRMKSFIPNQ
jgi:hypothetical protein